MKTKLDMLTEIAAKAPESAFPRYGIAMELMQLGRLEESARAFQDLSRDHASYVPCYFQHGKVLERLGRTDEARAVYRRGIDAAQAAGNRHAAEEIEAALGLLS